MKVKKIIRYKNGLPCYKCIGNGWTVDVVAHILKNMKRRILK